ncbi:Alpha/Beta hydrolase protein [Ilyonectria sp. MPI-CAGE-AT-0026]|nr:Alpha/Beta hydrolase protein [Ilyonectria sp. MPI-CAGE-AT-0026]
MLLLFFLFLAVAHAIVVSGPFGPWNVSHHVVELTDESRWDPYAPENSPHKRRILTSFFLPFHEDQQECEVDRIDYMPPRSLETYNIVAKALGLPNNTFQGLELDFCKVSSKKQLAHPVVIFSPGFSSSRLFSSAQAQSLASQGYVVITVDHPYEATIVEFPDGRVVYGVTSAAIDDETAEKAVVVRSQDISFLIDQISETSNLGPSFDGRFDMSKIFVYGHSLGGATSAQVAFNDDRVLGGLDLDGALRGSVSEDGLDVPFFVVSQEGTPDTTSYFKGFMDKLRGPKMLLEIDGTEHLSFVDLPLLLSLRDDVSPELQPMIAMVLGTIDGKRIADIVNNILSMVTSFLFEGKAESLCKLEDEVAEVTVVERDLNGTCSD